MNFTMRTMLSFSLFALLFSAYTSSIVAQSTFDFSLSAYGPHNVVQGHDLYIRISGKTLSGTGANTYLSVQNAPARPSRFWPDLATFCCGDGNDGSYWYGSADVDTALRITAGTATPQGSYTIQVTAVSNGVTRQI